MSSATSAYTAENSDASGVHKTRSKQSFRTSILNSIMNEAQVFSDADPKQPWMNTDGQLKTGWNQTRISLSKLAAHPRFEQFMSCVIIFNVAMIIYETNQGAKCFPDWYDDEDACPHSPSKIFIVRFINLSLLIIYVLEAALRIYVERVHYFRSRWNLLDFGVVVSGLVSEIVGGFLDIAFLRIFRIARLTRTFKLVLSVKELYMLIHGIGGSMRALFWGMAMLFGMLLIFSIVVVDFVHPMNSVYNTDCDRCPRSFASVPATILTLFQTMIAGDSWGASAIPAIEHQPLLFFLFAFMMITVALGAMNLILAVIVDSAADARDSDLAQKMKTKLKERELQKKELFRLCQELDKDDDATISMEEMMEAWHNSREFRESMMNLDISEKDLPTIFQILDKDQSGSLDFKEFVDELYDLRTCDIRLKMGVQLLRITETIDNMGSELHEVLQHLVHKSTCHEEVLSQHTGHLASIDSTVMQLLQGSEAVQQPPEVQHLQVVAPSISEKNLLESPPMADEVALLSSPPSPQLLTLPEVAPDPPRIADTSPLRKDASAPIPWKLPFEEGEAPTPIGSAKDLKIELGYLCKQFDFMYVLEEEVLKIAGEQLSVAQRQAQVMSQLHAGSGHTLPENADAQLGQLRRHTQVTLSALHDFQRWVEGTADGRAKGGCMVESLAMSLNMQKEVGLCDPPPAPPPESKDLTQFQRRGRLGWCAQCYKPPERIKLDAMPLPSER